MLRGVVGRMVCGVASVTRCVIGRMACGRSDGLPRVAHEMPAHPHRHEEGDIKIGHRENDGRPFRLLGSLHHCGGVCIITPILVSSLRWALADERVLDPPDTHPG